MDDIIREAASKHYPAYNDKAWEKMQQKLDIHLPQKDDRRRYIYWLLLLLLLSGSTFTGLLFYYNNKEKKTTQQVAVQPANQPASQPLPAGSGQPGNNGSNTGDDATTTTGTSASPVNGTSAQGNNQNPATAQDPKNASTAVSTNDPQLTAWDTRNDKGKSLSFNRKKNGRFNTSIIAPGQTTGNEQLTGDDKLFDPAGKRKLSRSGRTRMQINAPQAVTDNKTIKPGKKKKQDKPVTDQVETNEDPATIANTPVSPDTYQQRADKAITTATDTTGLKPTQPEEKKKEETEIVKKEEKKTDSAEKKITVSNKKPKPEEKKKKGFGNNFGITVSAGTDLSFIKLNKLGKATFIYGAGLSYDFAKRFTVQAGFLASKKIYTAMPDQYNLTTPHPYLENIDAVCKVYEIPVSISYRFAQKRNHNWFGGAGVSSFLMKQEDYDYVYKYPGGQTYTYKYSYSNENKHYFSVLSLFGGYQYKLGDRVSLMAGPYVKIPLGGVGAGKIKLNSGGLLLTATVKPFARKKK